MVVAIFRATGTSVTVLSTDDPVRVYQRFSTLDAVSGGRAEVILGRGSFTESFPLFGYSLDDYDVLFEEKLALFAALRDADHSSSRASASVSATCPGEWTPIGSGAEPSWASAWW